MNALAEQRNSKIVVATVIALAAVFAMSLGLTYPLLSIILEGQGISSTLIGLNSAMTPLGIIFTAPFIPAIARRVGGWRLATGCMLATAVMLFLIALVRDVWWWFPLRFLLGASIDMTFVISETWLLQLAADDRRGKLVGLYGTSLASGFAMGPLSLSIIGSDGWGPFVFGIAILCAATAGLFIIRRRVPADATERHGSVLSFGRAAPYLLFAVGVVACFDQLVLSLLPVYLLAAQFAEAKVSIALSVLVAGNIILQYPIGWLSDRISRRAVMIGCLLLALTSALLLDSVLRQIWIWPVLFVLGSAGFGIYALAMIDLGDRFKGDMLLAGNAAFALMWGIGGVFGPSVTGVAMDRLGTQGLPISIVSIFAALLLVTLLRGSRRSQSAGSA